MTNTPPYARQQYPGQPIELLWGNEVMQISDSAALLLASQLTQFVLGNIQAQVRANGD